MTALLLRFAIEYKRRAPSDAAKKLLPIVIADPPIWWRLEQRTMGSLGRAWR